MTDRRIIQDLAVAYWASRCLHVIAEFGIADLLGDQPQSAQALARASGTHAQSLHRVLRSLCNHGIFTHDGEAFAHNEASRALRSDAPGSMRSLARMMGLKVHWDAYRELDVGLRTGTPAIGSVLEGGLFGYLQSHPEMGRLFDEAMAGKSFSQVAAVLGAYDFSAFRAIGDIGGGLGHLLNGVLERNPQAHGMLFDLPEVIGHASRAAHPRIDYHGGDFFRDPIPPCDAYLLMTVLHDWSDEQSIAILRNIAATAPPGSKVLIIEGVVQPDARDQFLLDLDIEMLVMTSGRERTQAEWQAVLSGAGLRLSRQIPANPGITIIEVEPG